METPNRGNDEQNLERLFRAYREACPDPDPGPNFMPELWARIEARKTFSFFLGRWASGLVTAAAALTLAMAMYLYLPRPVTAFYSESYVEALASHSTDGGDLLEPAHFDLADSAGEL